MSDSNIVKFNSLALPKVNRNDPFSGVLPSDSTLALGNIQYIDIPYIVNNENYNPAITPTAGADNYPIKDGTLVYNRDSTILQYFYNGQPFNVVGSTSGLELSALPNTQGNLLVFDYYDETTTVAYISDSGVNISKLKLNNESVNLHEKRREESRKEGIEATVNPNTISNVGYIQFSTNNTTPPTTNSEGFVYLDGNPTIVLQHQTSTGTTPYNNVCTTFTGGGAGESSSSVNGILEINSTSGGFLPSRLTTAQISALQVNSLDNGLIVYNTTQNLLNICNGSTFNPISLKPLQVANLVSTINITLPATPALIDNVAPQIGDLILLTAQTTASQNGLYLNTANGLVSVNDQSVLVYALSGATNIGKLFYNNASNPLVISRPSPVVIGDLKHSTMTVDHNGWLICNGRSLSITAYPQLYSVIGTRYGNPGTGLFSLPNTVGKILADASTTNLAGTSAGQDSYALTTTQLPAHTHGTSALSTISAGSHTHGTSALSTNPAGSHTHSIDYTANGGADGPTRNNIDGSGSDTVNTNSAGSHSHTISGSTDAAGAHTHTISGNTDSTGGGAIIDNRQSTLYIDNVFIYAYIN